MRRAFIIDLGEGRVLHCRPTAAARAALCRMTPDAGASRGEPAALMYEHMGALLSSGMVERVEGVVDAEGQPVTNPAQLEWELDPEDLFVIGLRAGAELFRSPRAEAAAEAGLPDPTESGSPAPSMTSLSPGREASG